MSSKTITREQYVKACVAFWGELGMDLPVNGAYFPVHLDADRFTFPRTPGVDGNHVRASGEGFAGAESDEVLSIITTVKVVDE